MASGRYPWPVPKTLTGAELELDDAPARESRSLHRRRQQPRLPRVLRAARGARHDRRPADERAARLHEHAVQAARRLPAEGRRRRVGLAARCTGRRSPRRRTSSTRRAGKPMPDLLREQFPHFRPIVEAFGYRNLEFEGWEADDVIATLATRADAAGIKTCVVSTDRDAFQLCSDNICLMMTPRGVADVNVYTPERVEARYGVTPEQVPDFIGLKGDTSDNIPGVPGIGDKTAGQLIAQYGSLESVIEHAPELSPARARNITENADLARTSKELATMRRDLDIDCDPAQLVLEPARPRAAEGDLPALRVPQPAEPRRRARRGGAERADAGDRHRGAVARGRARLPRRRRLRGDRRPRRRRDRRRGRRRRRGPGSIARSAIDRARREDAARRRPRRHAARRVPDRSRPRRLRARRSRRRVRRRARADARGRGGDDRARAAGGDAAPADRRRCSSGSRSAASPTSTARSSCR